MLIINKKDERETAEWAREKAGKVASKNPQLKITPELIDNTQAGWLLALATYEDKPLKLEQFQIEYLLRTSQQSIYLKSRQVGFSSIIAWDNLALCHLKERHTGICVNYRESDGKEKIISIKSLWEDLPLAVRKNIVVSTQMQVGFSRSSNKGKRKSQGHISRFVCLPSNPPRGNAADVWLDEFAHCANDEKIWQGATGVISSYGGTLTVSSSPLGKRGKFYELWVNAKEKGIARGMIPWWLSSKFCKDVRKAAIEAPGLSTDERIEKFATDAIKQQRNLLGLVDFRQEFECVFVDEKVSFITFDLIKNCCQLERKDIPVYESLRELASAAKFMGPLFAGYDVGRTTDPSELMIFEKHEDESYTLRYDKQLKNVSFAKQEAFICSVVKKLGDHLRILRIDGTGPGRHIAENLKNKKRIGRKIRSLVFTRILKEDMAYNFKELLQSNKISLPNDREIIAQIHSIKQKKTSTGEDMFDSDKNKKHHADKFWAAAMAVLEPRKKKSSTVELGIRSSPKPDEVKPPCDVLVDLTGVDEKLTRHDLARLQDAQAAQKYLEEAQKNAIKVADIKKAIAAYQNIGDIESAIRLAQYLPV